MSKNKIQTSLEERIVIMKKDLMFWTLNDIIREIIKLNSSQLIWDSKSLANFHNSILGLKESLDVKNIKTNMLYKNIKTIFEEFVIAINYNLANDLMTKLENEIQKLGHCYSFKFEKDHFVWDERDKTNSHNSLLYEVYYKHNISLLKIDISKMDLIKDRKIYKYFVEEKALIKDNLSDMSEFISRYYEFNGKYSYTNGIKQNILKIKQVISKEDELIQFYIKEMEECIDKFEKNVNVDERKLLLKMLWENMCFMAIVLRIRFLNFDMSEKEIIQLNLENTIDALKTNKEIANYDEKSRLEKDYTMMIQFIKQNGRSQSIIEKNKKEEEQKNIKKVNDYKDNEFRVKLKNNDGLEVDLSKIDINEIKNFIYKIMAFIKNNKE